MKNTFTTLFFLVITNSMAQSITTPCGYDGHRRGSAIPENGIIKRGNGIFIIPVVFHVVLSDTTSVTDNDIVQQINTLNEDFGGITALKANVSPAYSEIISTDAPIRFCLVKVAPDGKPTSGITRKKIAPPQTIPFKSWLYDSKNGGVTAWDVKRYLNVWITDLVGIAGYSGGVSDSTPYDGIAIDIAYFGKNRSGNTYSEGHTLTHEAGHYLGLKHIWGDTTLGCDCSDSDNIDDTPNQDCPTYQCPAQSLVSCQQIVLYQNYMDYTEDACRSLFTKGQVLRMQQVLETYRASLTEQTLCSYSTPFYHATVFPNPVTQFAKLYNGSQELLQIDLYTVSGQYLTTWTSGDELISLDFSDVPSGVYFLKIKGDEKHFVLKIVVQR